MRTADNCKSFRGSAIIFSYILRISGIHTGFPLDPNLTKERKKLLPFWILYISRQVHPPPPPYFVPHKHETDTLGKRKTNIAAFTVSRKSKPLIGLEKKKQPQEVGSVMSKSYNLSESNKHKWSLIMGI